MNVAVKLRDYAQLMRLHRPIGILLLLWPTLWALWIAGQGRPDPRVFVVFVLGVVLMRSAGCVINDYADRDFDPHVARTRDRPVAAGRVSPREALALFAVLCLIAFALVLTLNRLTILLSFAGAFLAATYPFLKRYSHLPQFYLGMAFGWGIPMAFAAQTGGVPGLAWILFAANIFWAVAYDTAYAMVDREDDLKVGVKSTAILFGRHDRALIFVFHIVTIALLAWVGALAGLGLGYYAGLTAASGFALYQQRLMRHRDRDGCFRAFLNNNWFGAAVFAGLMVRLLIRNLPQRRKEQRKAFYEFFLFYFDSLRSLRLCGKNSYKGFHETLRFAHFALRAQGPHPDPGETVCRASSSWPTPGPRTARFPRSIRSARCRCWCWTTTRCCLTPR
jgi:4-hydroxybenzoate polyprenyltransferase